MSQNEELTRSPTREETCHTFLTVHVRIHHVLGGYTQHISTRNNMAKTKVGSLKLLYLEKQEDDFHYISESIEEEVSDYFFISLVMYKRFFRVEFSLCSPAPQSLSALNTVLSRALENSWKNSCFVGTPVILLEFCKEFEPG